jgi:hypothetical protein
MTEAPAHLGWERLWREQGRDLGLERPVKRWALERKG